VPAGTGVGGMRDRAGLVGGSVEITSSGGHGTVVRLRVPAAVPGQGLGT
jgi:two-component system sensor histidine kinase UhpB